MFGLEKKQKELFEFDLEKELKNDENKKSALLKDIEKNILEIKERIRKGASSEDFDNYGILLHGFTALEKVVKKIPAKK